MVKGSRFQFKQYEAYKALKVLGWSVASALIAFLIALLDATEVPVEYAFLVPLVNVILYSLKEFVTDNSLVE